MTPRNTNNKNDRIITGNLKLGAMYAALGNKNWLYIHRSWLYITLVNGAKTLKGFKKG